MATQMHLLHRTQGDGMERIENDNPIEESVALNPKETIENVVNAQKKQECSRVLNKSEFKTLGSAVKLVPQTVNKKKTKLLEHLKNKEPKFVPYEPYKAAVRPIVPIPRKSISSKSSQSNPNDGVEIFRAMPPTVSVETVTPAKKKQIRNESECVDVDWQNKLKVLESELHTLKEENEQLETQLKFQVQVNGELKNLLVAAVGEDIETKVHVLTEDKLHLAQALLRSSESLTSHQEQTEWLAGQCEVWRSKFLASSVMVEELARWKASLSQKVNESQDALKKFLAEHKVLRECVIKTYDNLIRLRDNFDLHNRKKKLNSWTLLDVCEENSKLTDSLLLELLGVNKSEFEFERSNLNDFSQQWKKTTAEKSAEHILANPNSLHLIEPDAACNAVVGAAVTLSGQLYLQSHPPKMEYCPQCTGEIKLL